jgi:hypothetical protein
MEVSMTYDPQTTLTVALSGLAGLGMVTAAGLAGWRGWLALKHQELAGRLHGAAPAGGIADPDLAAMAHAGSRIEMADLKERIRKLEAIAAGVDL